ncbi:MAG: oligogalacturonate lyase family protein [Chthoniobacteraceae bacterium]
METMIHFYLSLPISAVLVSFYAMAVTAPATENSSASAPARQPIPAEFKDPETGARILHLSKIPNEASGVIYFTQPCITPDSRYTLIRYLERSAGHTAGKLYRYDFINGELIPLIGEITKCQILVPASGNVYYTIDDGHAIRVTNIYDLKTRNVATMPAGVQCSSGLTINADESVVVGTGNLIKEHKGEAVLKTPPNQGPAFETAFNQHDTNLILAANIKSGEVTELHRIDTWLGHPQFSPTDPNLLMYCHEGPWAKVDRIWTLRLGNRAQPEIVHPRTEENEIAGHEFWSTDGQTIWFDHNFRNTPGKAFLEGKNLATGAITRYPTNAFGGSIHYVQSSDGKFFVADGHAFKGDPQKQAMYILVPENGNLRQIRLCSMSKNDYAAAEPNPHLTPDQHWVVFTATLHGTSQAYAVEMPKEFWR